MTFVAVTCMHKLNEGHVFLKDTYIEALEKAGLTPIILPASLSPKACAKVLAKVSGLVLTGGGDMSPLHIGEQPQPNLGTIEPTRDEQEMVLIREARRLGMPMLGICRGIQMINLVLGGGIIQHLKENEPNSIQHKQKAVGWHRHHHVEIQPDTILADIFGTGVIGVNSFHHQAVGDVAPELRASAIAPDGIVEAVESRSPWILGMQWHPEILMQKYPEFLEIFQAFAKACGEYEE